MSSAVFWNAYQRRRVSFRFAPYCKQGKLKLDVFTIHYESPDHPFSSPTNVSSFGPKAHLLDVGGRLGRRLEEEKVVLASKRLALLF